MVRELRRHKIYLLFIVLFICCLKKSFGQDVLVRSGFFEDSLIIGDKTRFYLAAEYPTTAAILFPDSTFAFSPFEYEKRTYFTTKTSGGKSYDSVIYYLSTFEIDRIQSLSLPVYQLNPLDCTAVYSRRDTILLAELVKNLPDSITAQNVPLKVNTAYQKVSYLFNYPILIIVVTVLLVTVIVVWIIFGKRIRTYFRLKRMHKAHQNFLEAYSSYVENINTTFSSITAENALSRWKKYMEQLEARPYTKLTTREVMQLEKNESLAKNLHAVDGAIYGHSTNIIDSLENLKVYADERFAKKVEEVKHG